MALKELQAAAVRLVHVVQPTDRDVAALTQRFALHPHDLEAMFGVQTTNQISPFRDYVMASFVWPVYQAERRDLQLQDFSLMIGPTWLVIVESQGSPEIDAFVTEQLHPTGTDSSVSLVGELLARLARRTDQQATWFAGDVVTTLGDRDARAYGQALLDLSDHFLKLLDHVPGQPTEDAQAMIRIAAHRLQHRGQLLQALRRSTARAIPSPTFVSPQLVRSYAWVSAVVVVVMLGWLIGQ